MNGTNQLAIWLGVGIVAGTVIGFSTGYTVLGIVVGIAFGVGVAGLLIRQSQKAAPTNAAPAAVNSGGTAVQNKA